MGLTFDFATATKIIFGNNSVEKVPEIVASNGNIVLLVTGKNRKQAELLGAKLQKLDCKILYFSVEKEPTTTIIEEGINLARVDGCNVVVGLGGGSVIDSAKAIAAMVPNKGSLTDYLEVIGLGKPLTDAPLPFIAVPTTAGTGAEATKNAVIKSEEYQVKVSLRSDKMFPAFAIVDPVLSLSMPPALTASTGMDALTHLLETFVSNQSNPFIDVFCRDGMCRISTSLVKAFKNGTDIVARENLSMASLLGGMALANVKLGAIHGFASPMGGMYPIPHGEVCASLLPAVFDVNISALKKQGKDLSRFDEVARIFSGNPNAKAEDGTEIFEKLVRELNIPRLTSFGLIKTDFPELVEKAKNASSMKGNPVKLSDDELFVILEKSL